MVGIFLAVILLLIVASFALLYFVQSDTKESTAYQAVFLSNNQVYFGKVMHEHDQYVELTDVYYLQVNRSLQGEGEESEQKSDIALVKLGSELHGPNDLMRVNRDGILYIEELRDDSQVVQAIAQHKNK